MHCCSNCGAPHSNEQPLTLVNNALWCPDCLEEIDKVEYYKALRFVQSQTCPGLFFAVGDYEKMQQVTQQPHHLPSTEEIAEIFRIPSPLIGDPNSNQ